MASVYSGVGLQRRQAVLASRHRVVGLMGRRFIWASADMSVALRRRRSKWVLSIETPVYMASFYSDVGLYGRHFAEASFYRGFVL